MTDFRKLTDSIYASPQITYADIDAAAEAGFSLIVNNRPDGEDANAPQGADIQRHAAKAGLSYLAIPIDHSGFDQPQIDRMLEAIKSADGPILAYCRSGTRSTFLWSLAEATRGTDPDSIIEAARSAGYDVTPIRPMIEQLAAR